MKKTIQVKDLKDKANKFMLHSADEITAERAAVFHFVSSFLHDTGNYKGFGYLTQEDMKASGGGKTFGILPYDPNDKDKDRFVDTDRTRVILY